MPDWDDTIGSNWVDPAILRAHPHADSRHAPYAGICIDPYSGPRPGVGYPDVVYPEGSAERGQYNKLFSSNIELVRVEVVGFVVGVAVQPGDADGNGDFVTLRKSSIAACRYGLSVGNSQSRNVGLLDCDFTTVHTVATTIAHGRQIGRLGGTWTNVSVNGCYRLFDIHLSYAGPIGIYGLYCESLFRIGDFGPGSAADTACLFSASYFSFDAQQVKERGNPSTVLTAGEGQVIFQGCGFRNYPTVLYFKGKNCEFSNCLFAGQWQPSNEVERLAYNATTGGLVPSDLGRRRSSRFHRIQYTQYDVESGSVFPVVQLPVAECTRSRTAPLCSEAIAPLDHGEFVVANSISASIVAKAELEELSVVGRSVRIRFARRSEADFMLKGPVAGDLVLDDLTGTICLTVRRVGQVVEALALNNYRTTEATSALVAALDSKKGNLLVGNARKYTVTQPLTASAAGGAVDSLTAIGRIDGTSQHLSEVHAGDWLGVDEQGSAFWRPENARIVRIEPAVGRLLLSGPAGVTGWQDRPLPPLVRYSN
jgi:hypothetical protein